MTRVISVLASMLVWPGLVVAGEDVTYEVLVALREPKKDSGRSREGGLEHVPFAAWVPGDVEVVRGFVFNPYYTKAVGQEHWQAAARHWGFGVLGANFFGAKADEMRGLVGTALGRFAEQSGHPEVAQAVLCPVGMSAGAGMSTRIAELMPERVVAVGPVCLEVGPRDEASLAIPMLTVFGERDGKQYEKLMAKLADVRGQGGRFGIAVQWGRRHEFGQANNLIFPMFDAVIEKRVGKVGEALRAYSIEEGWLGDVSGWKDGEATVAAYGDYEGDKGVACWLPDEATARAWQAFVSFQPALRLKSPAGLGDKQPFVVHKPGEPVLVELKGEAEVAGAVEVFAGATKLGELEGGKLEVRFPEAGVYPVFLKGVGEGGEVMRSRPHTVVVE